MQPDERMSPVIQKNMNKIKIGSFLDTVCRTMCPDRDSDYLYIPLTGT
jgi:hypothetical protein